MPELLKIGAFARLANVTVKTLRFYADQGLLPPAHVDGRSGYRYYTLSQVPVLTKILNLREAGFGLAEIAKLVSAEGGAAPLDQAIEAQRCLLLEQKSLIESRLQVVEALARSLRDGGDAIAKVRLIVGEPQRAFTLRNRVGALGAPVSEMFERAEAEVAAYDARANRNPFLLFHDAGDGANALDLEVCIPVKDTAPPELTVRTVPGAPLSCSLIYTGDYAQTDHLYRELSGWLRAASLKPQGPMREIYHRFGADEAGYTLPKYMLASQSSDYVTELQLGVALEEGGGIERTSKKKS